MKYDWKKHPVMMLNMADVVAPTRIRPRTVGQCWRR